MDSDVVLERLRMLMRKFDAAVLTSGRAVLVLKADDVCSLMEAFSSLDHHLCIGGQLPCEWQAARDPQAPPPTTHIT